jgi:O-antigen ligase
MSTLVGLDRVRSSVLVDALAAAVAVSLPWSTSATAILVSLWAIALVSATIPGVDLKLLQRVLRSPAGVLPLVLVAVGFIGMAWAPVPFSERIGGFDSFPKLLAIPFLMVEFQRSPRGHWALIGFLASASVLLMFSWYVYFFQANLSWRIKDVAVPFKDRITQGTVFTLCLFGLLECIVESLQRSRPLRACLGLVLAAMFFFNIVFATVSRTALVAVPLLLILFGARHLRRRQLVVFLVGLLALGAALWEFSPYLHERIAKIPVEITAYQAHDHDTSAGARIEFWKDSVEIIKKSPLIGHGTGAITEAFARLAGTTSNATNPHNQILTVGIQLGLLGVALLIAMWAAHGWLFCGPSVASWIGFVVVLENVIASTFNSQLFDFTTGWIYVFGVGVAGGMVMKERGDQPPLYDFSSTIAEPKA